MLSSDSKSGSAASPFDISQDATLPEVIKVLQALQEAFAAHTHDGVNSQQLIALALQALSSLTIAVRKSSYSDPTPGFWVGLVNNVAKFALGDGTTDNSLTWDGTTLSVSNISVKKSFTAHSAITAGQAMVLGSGTSGYLTADNKVTSTEFALGDQLNGSDNRYLAAQTFITNAKTTAIRAVLLDIRADNLGGGGSYSTQVDIYATDVNHQPSGSSLGTKSLATTQNVTAEYTFEFTNPVPVSPSTEYAIVVTNTTTVNGGSTWVKINGSGYSGYYYTNEPFGAAVGGPGPWATAVNTSSFYFRVWEVLTASGQVQPSDTTQTKYSTDNYDLANNFIGFASSAVSAGQSVQVAMSGADVNQTGLTIGKTYYLSGSGGAIATSAGAVSVRIGFSIAANAVFIHPDNYPS